MGDRPDYKNYYDILGVPRNADAEAIKARFRQLAKELHPDGAGATSQATLERFKAVNDAYQVLKDPAKRQMIDEYLSGRAMGRRPFGTGESFIDRFAGIRPKSRSQRRTQPRYMRFLEIALSPRVMMTTTGLVFMGYLFLGPRDNSEPADAMVQAWFNPRSQRWETPAPWNDDYRKPDVVHRKVHKYLVFNAGGPPGGAAASGEQ